MEIDYRVRVTNTVIFVEVPQKNIKRQFRNLLGLVNGKVVSVGQSLEDMIKENPQNAEKFRDEVKFETLYTPTRAGLEQLHLFLDFQHYQLRDRKLSLFGSELIRVNLDLPDYESIELVDRNQFEFSLTKSLAQKLEINHILKGWQRWQRWMLDVSRFAFLLAWPFLWYWLILALAPQSQNWGAGRLVIYFVALFLIYYLLIIMRILFLKFILPHDLLRSEILSSNMGIGKYRSFFLERILKD